MNRLIRYFAGILPFFAAEAIQLIVIIILNMLYSVFLGFKIGVQIGMGKVSDKGTFTQQLTESMSQDMLYLFSVFAVIVCGVVFFFWYRIEVRGEVRGDKKLLFTPKNMTFFLLLGLGCQLFFSGIMGLLQPVFIKIFEDYAKTLEGLVSGNGIIVLLLLIFVAPIAEELIFRGMILHKTSRVIPFVGANILQALLFGIYHWNIVQGIYATLMGLLLGLVYHKFRTIYAPILLHMVINASALLVALVPDFMLAEVLLVISGILLLTGVLMKLRPFVFQPVSMIEDANSEKITFD